MIQKRISLARNPSKFAVNPATVNKTGAYEYQHSWFTDGLSRHSAPSVNEQHEQIGSVQPTQDGDSGCGRWDRVAVSIFSTLLFFIVLYKGRKRHKGVANQ
jgi:hypothetical protein